MIVQPALHNANSCKFDDLMAPDLYLQPNQAWLGKMDFCNIAV